MNDFQMAPWPYYDEEQVLAVTDVLRSGRVNYWTGEQGRLFEQEYADYLGRKHAVAVANGTLALELALEAFGVGAGDEVIVPARTYIASASCAAVRGAVPVVADVDPVSQLITAASIEAVLTPRTRAVVVVHLAGWPCEMDEIMALAARHQLVVIEDCAQAHGAFYKGRPVGSLGHAGAFSFCQDKILTTGGEGGLLALDDERAWRRAWAYKDIGRSYEAVFERQHPPGFRWLTESFGSNWRLTEMQAALGRIQLKRLPVWRAQRAANAQVLIDALAGIEGVSIPLPPAYSSHAWYRFYFFIEPLRLLSGWSRERLMAEIEALGVPVSVGSCAEIYREQAFRSKGWGPGLALPVAQALGERSVCLLIHPTLDGKAMQAMAERVCEVVRQALE